MDGTARDQALPPYMTASQVADAIQVTAATVYKWIRECHLPAVRLPGRHVRVRREDLDAFLNGRVEGGADGSHDPGLQRTPGTKTAPRDFFDLGRKARRS